MKGFLIGILSGAIIGTVATIYIMPYGKKIAPDKITVNTISGDPAKVEKAKAGKTSVSITEKHGGEGSSEIIIPYSEIPPAKKWIEKTQCVEVMMSTRLNLYGKYSYRYESIIFSGGVCLPVNDFTAWKRYDIFAGAGVWF